MWKPKKQFFSYENEVKHTVIEQSEEGKYYLDEGFVFNSIVVSFFADFLFG